MLPMAAPLVLLEQSLGGKHIFQLLPQAIAHLAHVMRLLMMLFQLVIPLIVHKLQSRRI